MKLDPRLEAWWEGRTHFDVEKSALFSLIQQDLIAETSSPDLPAWPSYNEIMERIVSMTPEEIRGRMSLEALR